MPEHVGRDHTEQHPDLKIVLEEGVHPANITFNSDQIDSDANQERQYQKDQRHHCEGTFIFRFFISECLPGGYNGQRHKDYQQGDIPESCGREEYGYQSTNGKHDPQPFESRHWRIKFLASETTQ